jgi:hypothetical protein
MKTKSCDCGKTSGKYLADGSNAVYNGNGIPLGFVNSSFTDSLMCRPLTGYGKEFTAFVIPRICQTISIKR